MDPIVKKHTKVVAHLESIESKILEGKAENVQKDTSSEKLVPKSRRSLDTNQEKDESLYTTALEDV